MVERLWTLIKRKATAKKAGTARKSATKKTARKTATKKTPAPRSGAVAKPKRAASPKPATVAA